VAIDELTPFCDAEEAHDHVTWLTSLTRFDGYELKRADDSWKEKVEAFITEFDRMYDYSEFSAVLDHSYRDEKNTTSDQRVAELIKHIWRDDQDFLNEVLTEVPAGYKWEIVENACESYKIRVFNPYPEEEGPE
jgi:hypothetical protein